MYELNEQAKEWMNKQTNKIMNERKKEWIDELLNNYRRLQLLLFYLLWLLFSF